MVFVMVGIVAAVMIGLAVRAYRTSGAVAESWARERGLELTDANAAMVSWYLRSSRTLRLLGAMGGFLLSPLAGAALGDQFLGSSPWLAGVGGYLVGLVFAEVSLRRPQGTAASMRPRELSDYLSPSALAAQRRTAAAVIVVAAIAAVVPMREPAIVSPHARIAVLVGAVAVFVSVEGIQRWLIRRPQPVVSASLLEADEAIRVQSVHSIAGAGLALQWLLAGAALWSLVGSDVQLLRWTMWAPAILSWAIAFAMCTYYDAGVWQLRRSPG